MSTTEAGGRMTTTSTPCVDRASVGGEGAGSDIAHKPDGGGAPPWVAHASGPGPGLQDALTQRQRGVLEAIESFWESRGYPPTLREIAEAVGLASVSSVSHHLACLEDKGYLSRHEGRPRTAVVRPFGHSVQPEAEETPTTIRPLGAAFVPWVGRIAAGDPIPIEQSMEDVFPCPGNWSGRGTCSCSRSSVTQ